MTSFINLSQVSRMFEPFNLKFLNICETNDKTKCMSSNSHLDCHMLMSHNSELVSLKRMRINLR